AAMPRPSAGCRDGPTVQLDHAARDGEAETEAAVRAIAGLLPLHEGLEDLAEQERLDTDAVVPHIEQHAPVLAARAELDVATRRRILGRVHQQVRDGLRDAMGINLDR